MGRGGRKSIFAATMIIGLIASACGSREVNSSGDVPFGSQLPKEKYDNEGYSIYFNRTIGPLDVTREGASFCDGIVIEVLFGDKAKAFCLPAKDVYGGNIAMLEAGALGIEYTAQFPGSESFPTTTFIAEKLVDGSYDVGFKSFDEQGNLFKSQEGRVTSDTLMLYSVEGYPYSVISLIINQVNENGEFKSLIAFGILDWEQNQLDGPIVQQLQTAQVIYLYDPISNAMSAQQYDDRVPSSSN